MNAAQASLNGKEWGDAIAHATSALGKEPDNVKALYRRGVARWGIVWYDMVWYGVVHNIYVLTAVPYR